MTRGSGRRANNPAIMPAERAAWLRVALLEHFDADAEFRSALRDLHAEVDAWDRLRDFAARYGLDRMEPDAGGLDGIELLRRWRVTSGPDGPLSSAFAHGPARPPARVSTTIAYNPPAESRHDARVRLLARIEELLDEGDALATAQGYVLLHMPSRMQDSVRWLYERIRFRWSWKQIADHEQAERPKQALSDSALRKDVTKIAGQAGVRLGNSTKAE